MGESPAVAAEKGGQEVAIPVLAATLTTAVVFFPVARSEERRVGKECRSRCDWSSDVCSSDLDGRVAGGGRRKGGPGGRHPGLGGHIDDGGGVLPRGEIGRASCRERV